MNICSAARSLCYFLLAVSMNACQPAHDWIVQYPGDYKPIVQSTLVHTYNRDSIFKTGLTILEVPAIYANEQGAVWVAEGGGDVLFASDGVHFKHILADADYQLNAISGIGNEVWVGGVYGTMLHCTKDNCEREKLPGKPQDIWGLKIAPNGIDGWARNNNGTLYRRSVAGWQLLDTLYAYKMHGIWCSENCKDVWLTCDSGRLMHLEGDKGLVVTQLPTFTDLYGIAMSGNGQHGWVGGDDRSVWELKKGNWQKVDDVPLYIPDVKCSADGEEAWGVGDYNQVYHYSGGKWHILPVVAGISRAKKVFFDESECWILNLDGAFHSTDKRYFSKVEFGEQAGEATAISANNSNIWIGGWDYNVFKVKRKVQHYYPALSALRFKIRPGGDSVHINFKFTSRQPETIQNLPDSIWLNAFVKNDTVHPRIVSCHFNVLERDSMGFICKAAFPIDSLITGFNAPEERFKAKLALSCMFKNGNEVVTYGLTSGNHDYIYFRK